MSKVGQYLGTFLFLFFTFACFLVPSTQAVVDPFGVPNNRFGIHIISPSPTEASEAADLVNSSGGDWGYLTVLIEDKDRKADKWQEFFNELRRRHLIPLVRLTTHPVGESWARPGENEAKDWAEFLNKLNWPTKNRYIIVYNEPNHGKEWGGGADASSYAQELDKTINAFRVVNPDFFMLNAGLDASTPQEPPNYVDQQQFMVEMNKAVPGIFDRLDGWVSHSYPNPGFVGSPEAIGRGSVRTWQWEMDQLKSLGLKKDLPIFITETGWRHADGLVFNRALPTTDTVANYYQDAFEHAWNNNKIVAVTPFLLNYQEPPFDHFSFKKMTGEKQKDKILGAKYPDFNPHYEVIADLPKSGGKPVQDLGAKWLKGSLYPTLVAGESYVIPFTFENSGQSIWNDGNEVKLVAVAGGQELAIEPAKISNNNKVEPGNSGTFPLKLTTPMDGSIEVSLQLFQDDNPMGTALNFKTEIKGSVSVAVKAALKWKGNPAGEYILDMANKLTSHWQKMTLGSNGKSSMVESKYLLPDAEYQFTLTKPFYHSKTITRKVQSGDNTIDFGTLDPDIPSAILKPQQLWELLPFSQ